jgi:hypothetical protein
MIIRILKTKVGKTENSFLSGKKKESEEHK